MPLQSLHPLPNNPTTGQQPLAGLSGRGLGGSSGGPPPASAAGGGGVSRETLKGLQDVVWSDDEDDPDCILCAEPLDLSDLNFKPCQCGMQICQFCYNKLLSTDPRCPGCRRPYDTKAVVFQPVDWEEVKRAKEKKARRAKTIKQLDSIGRRHLLGVRIVMKNMVYVVGMKLPALGDEAIPILRSNDYFGQYGKVAKLYLPDRAAPTSSTHTPNPDNPSTSPGIYIVYVRREDAARAIAALDGFPAPQGPPGTVLRATYGTTRYCEAFLRGLKCDTVNCMNLHEWGGESDCFTKEDMETALLRPAEYDARQKQSQIVAPPLSVKLAWPKPSGEEPIGSTGLPSSANWGKNVVTGRTPVRSVTPNSTRTVKSNLVPLGSKNTAFPLPTPSPLPVLAVKEKRKTATATAMVRVKSTDSTQSGTGSSGQTSPKKKALPLPASNVKATVLPEPEPVVVGPPPGLGPTRAESSRKRQASPPEQLEGDPLAGSISADSEAGPSIASPAPQTPARSSELPPPLTSEPIYVHSPYEEPRIVYFPASDPGFAFVLDLDEGEVARHQAAAGGYQPSPFSKTLVDLAELGVLAPEVPQLLSLPPGLHGFSGSFQPFDSVLDASLINGDSGSSEREEGEEGPRTTSRFDFARPGSAVASARGQSPFAIRWPNDDAGSNSRNGWMGPHQLPSSGAPQVVDAANDARAAALAAQVASFVGSYDSSNNEVSWPAESNYMVSPSFTRLQHGHGRDEREVRMHQFAGKVVRGDQDDFDPNPLQYAQHNASRGRNFFSPESMDDRPLHSPSNLYHLNGPHHGTQQQQQQGQPLATPTRGGPFPDARSLQQYHQLRTGSPTPMGFRRY